MGFTVLSKVRGRGGGGVAAITEQLESRQSPFWNLQDIYRIWAVSPFEFTRHLKDLDSLSFSFYMKFTESGQSSF